MADFENNNIGPDDGEQEPSPRTDDTLNDQSAPDDGTRETPADPAPGADASGGGDAEEKPASSGVNGISLAMSLCDAVLYAVGRDRFHGGIRPDNISVRDGQVFLGGTLKHNVGEFTPQELEYMAPELFWDGIRSPAADVYSMGLVLYSLYNYGRLPFWPSGGAITPNARAAALQRRMSSEAIQPPEGADAELAAVILRALAFRTEERWQDVAELRDALGSCDAENSPVDISLALSGLLSRSTEPREGDPGAFQSKNHTYIDEGEIAGGRRPQRRKNLSWLWILLAIVFIAGAVVLLVNDQFKIPREADPTPTPVATAIPTAKPTEEPTPEPTNTPEPTRRPSGPKYVLYHENVSWSEAVRLCEEAGGWLAMPMNEEELGYVSRLCNNEGLTCAWLGASRQPDGRWVTPGGDELTFFKWDEGEPSMVDAGDGAAENCLLLWREGDEEWYFNDSRDDPLEDYFWLYDGKIGFVCQMW